VLLAPPPSRARGWYGATIIKHRKLVAEQQEAWEADAAKNFYIPKGGFIPNKGINQSKKAAKVKLIPPRKAKG
jgi:hypothetical protein